MIGLESHGIRIFRRRGGKNRCNEWRLVDRRHAGHGAGVCRIAMKERFVVAPFGQKTEGGGRRNDAGRRPTTTASLYVIEMDSRKRARRTRSLGVWPNTAGLMSGEQHGIGWPPLEKKLAKPGSVLAVSGQASTGEISSRSIPRTVRLAKCSRPAMIDRKLGRIIQSQTSLLIA